MTIPVYCIENKDFYPTPDSLVYQMWKKVKQCGVSRILEPSAGVGNIVSCIKRLKSDADFSCIEKDSNMRSILIGKNFKVIDSDFLSYPGYDHFDLIIMNPPFSEGDKHLLKAIDIMHDGQIVCLLNAETLKNPFSNTRKILLSRLEEMEADIEYIQSAFLDADRKTAVEVAIVLITKKPDEAEKMDLFNGAKDGLKGRDTHMETKEETLPAPRDTIESIVREYEDVISHGMDMIRYYVTNKRRIGGFLTLINCGADNRYSSGFGAAETINRFLTDARKFYWRKVLELKDVKDRLTENVRREFDKQIAIRSQMEFSEDNIREFIINLIGSFNSIISKAIEDVFEKMTNRHHISEYSANIHYFNGWKTNKAFLVNKKIILPLPGYYSGYMVDKLSRHALSWDAARYLDDIDIVMNYFSAEKEYVRISQAINAAKGVSTGILSTYFSINFYQKGTIHLRFRDEDIRRRFNIEGCKGRNWLPDDYGCKPHAEMSEEEKAVVESFEGVNSYNRNIHQVGMVNKNLLQIA